MWCWGYWGVQERRGQGLGGESGLCCRSLSTFPPSTNPLGEFWGWASPAPDEAGWGRARPLSPPSVTSLGTDYGTQGFSRVFRQPPLGRCWCSPSNAKYICNTLLPLPGMVPFLHINELQLILQVHRPFPLALKSVWNRTKYRTVDAHFFTKKKRERKIYIQIYLYICIHTYLLLYT